MSEEELDETLRRFYSEARTKTGEEYSGSSLPSFRNFVEWHFNGNNRLLTLTCNPAFSHSNKMLESKLKALWQEGKENVQHEPVIESGFTWPFTGVAMVVKANIHFAARVLSSERTLMETISPQGPKMN